MFSKICSVGANQFLRKLIILYPRCSCTKTGVAKVDAVLCGGGDNSLGNCPTLSNGDTGEYGTFILKIQFLSTIS